jgi:lipopolysaccharide export LptBFGC system permease protein LptF
MMSSRRQGARVIGVGLLALIELLVLLLINHYVDAGSWTTVVIAVVFVLIFVSVLAISANRISRRR